MDFNGKIILAPLAGISDTVFRGLCKRHGADIVVSEMVSAEGVVRNAEPTLKLLPFEESERPIGVQLFGANPEALGRAAAYVEREARPDFIDLNCGCPIRKIVKKNGGASLLKNPELFERIVDTLVTAVAIPVTVKIRSGWYKDRWVDTEYARIAQRCGAAAIAVHARSATMGFSGHAFWGRIAQVKKSVTIPVIGNGDIVEPGHARAMIEQTGCDSVMIGRGAWGNPWLLGQCRAVLQGQQPAGISAEQRLHTAREHLRAYAHVFGGHAAAKEMKRHLVRYIKALPGASSLRKSIFEARTVEELESILSACRDGSVS